MKERHLLGFSLSFCVKDICMGKVDIKEVLFIHSACRPRHEEDIEEILKQYCGTYWQNFPDTARKVVQELLNDSEGPRIGWANANLKATAPIYWGHWLSINKGIIV